MQNHQFLLTLESPDGTTADQAQKALLEAVQLGRSRLAGASRDEVAIRYLKTTVLRVESGDSSLNTLSSLVERFGGTIIGSIVSFDCSSKADRKKRDQGDWPERVSLFKHTCSALGYKTEMHLEGYKIIFTILTGKA